MEQTQEVPNCWTERQIGTYQIWMINKAGCRRIACAATKPSENKGTSFESS